MADIDLKFMKGNKKTVKAMEDRKSTGAKKVVKSAPKKKSK